MIDGELIELPGGGGVMVLNLLCYLNSQVVGRLNRELQERSQQLDKLSEERQDLARRQLEEREQMKVYCTTSFTTGMSLVTWQFLREFQSAVI